MTAELPARGVTALPPPPDAVAQLSDLDLLARTSPDDLASIAAVVDWFRIDAGAQLFAAGDPADGMYLVVRGRLESGVDGAVLGEIGRGGTFGETAMLGGVRRTASVRALRDSVLVRLPPEKLRDLAESSPDVALGLARLVARRSAVGPRPIRGVPGARSIAVVALDAPSSHPGARAKDPADRLADDLARTSSPRRLVHRVRTEELRRWHAEGGADAVAQRLAELEDRIEVVLVAFGVHGREHDGRPATDPRALAPTTLRQMDTIVGVASAGGTPDATVGALLAEVGRPLTLALVHHTTALPRDTHRWLAALGSAGVRHHVHLRAGDAADVARLGRALVGRSVGLVLGGGGSRGFAHIGVVRALREAGISIDRVGGSSMGAVMGAQLAMGWTPDEMLARNRAAWSRRRMLDVGLPTLSLLRGRRGLAVLRGFFGERRIEDLWLDFFCTTVDLSRCRLHVRRSGPVTPWVAASATVPGLWPPLVDDDGHLHVDGGMLDNVPTGVMRASHPGSVIGVDVCHRQSPMRTAPRSALPGGLALLTSRRRGQWSPSILDIMNRANLLASLQHHEQSQGHADLYLTPPVEDQGFAAFDRVGELAELGYRSTVDALAVADLAAFG